MAWWGISSATGDEGDGGATIEGSGVWGGIGSDAGTWGVMGTCTAGVGGVGSNGGTCGSMEVFAASAGSGSTRGMLGASSGNVDDANAKLDVQSRGAGVTESARNNKLRQSGSRAARRALGVKDTPISSSLLVGSTRTGYETVGDVDAIPDVYS